MGARTIWKVRPTESCIGTFCIVMSPPCHYNSCEWERAPLGRCAPPSHRPVLEHFVLIELSSCICTCYISMSKHSRASIIYMSGSAHHLEGAPHRVIVLYWNIFRIHKIVLYWNNYIFMSEAQPCQHSIYEWERAPLGRCAPPSHRPVLEHFVYTKSSCIGTFI